MVKINGSSSSSSYSVFLLSSLCIISVIVICCFTSDFAMFTAFYGSRFELQQKLIGSRSSDRRLPAVQFVRSSSAFYDLRPENRSNPSENVKLSSSMDEVPAVRFARLNSSFSDDRLRNRTSNSRRIKSHKTKPKLEQGLIRARAAIRRAASSSVQNISAYVNGEDMLSSVIYRNPATFYRSYMEMEKRLKVYIYEEGDPPIVHDGPCKDIYTSEGRFIKEIEHGSGGKFRTRDAKRAHLYFMPFSVTRMVKYLYKPLSYDRTPLRQFVSDYVRVISTKHPFWNRTHGADHFMLACHDWGPHASQGNSHLYNTSIRVLCNANTSEGFNPQKDVTLPEIHLYDGNISPKLTTFLASTTNTTTNRQHLAFFAGGLHGPIRPILLNHWKNRDPDLRVYEYLPKTLDYYTQMLNSKFCLCPSGHEVASPRIVEAFYAECVPVIISENYVLPFSDVLKWEEFSVTVEVREIEKLKEVLMGVSEEKYKRLVEGVRAVRKHFVLNEPVKRFDVFHMVLHSIWLRRINLQL